MKRISIYILGVTIMLVACKKDTVQTAQEKSKLSLEKLGAKKKHPVPISWNMQNDPDPDVPPLPCVTGGTVGGGLIPSGTMTHLGKIDAKNSFTIAQSCEYLSPTQITINYNSQTSAANGDLLFTSDIIYFTVVGPTAGTFTGHSTITGGTGRFLNATGFIDIENGVTDLVTGHSSWTGDGEITY